VKSRGRAARKFDNVESVWRAMRGGQVLRHYHFRGAPIWVLDPSGREVMPGAAALAIASRNVIAVDESMFPGCTFSQTYKWR
jgi:hypothetical protein